MQNRKFSERLNQELDNIGVPQTLLERVEALSRLIKIPKFKAEALLNGATTPDAHLLAILAAELEVNEQWLIGKSDETTH